MKSLWLGIHEVFVKDGDGTNRVGYFDAPEKALAAVAEDKDYRAVWFSLNECPGVPDGYEPNRLYRATARYRKGDYKRRQLLLLDCDPKRPADTSATDEQKKKAHAQALAVREFLRNLGFPEPVFADSGNGYHLLYSIDEPNDEATESLIRNLLAGLSVNFSDEGSNLDEGNFECNRVCKLYSTWARKGTDSALWRRSSILEIPTHDVEIPAKHGARETVRDTAFEPVPRSILEAAVSELPVPRNTALGVMDDDSIRKTDWLRKLCEVGGVAILKERRRGAEFIFDIECPRAKSHGSTTSESATIVSYERFRGYSFSCLHASCSSKDPRDVIRGFSGFRQEIDPKRLMSDKLPGIPEDASGALSEFRGQSISV